MIITTLQLYEYTENHKHCKLLNLHIQIHYLMHCLATEMCSSKLMTIRGTKVVQLHKSIYLSQMIFSLFLSVNQHPSRD